MTVRTTNFILHLPLVLSIEITVHLILLLFENFLHKSESIKGRRNLGARVAKDERKINSNKREGT